MISSLRWVPKGKALRHPVAVALDDDEFARIQSHLATQLKHAKLMDPREEDIEGKENAVNGDNGNIDISEENEEIMDEKENEESENPNNQLDANGENLDIYNLDSYDDPVHEEEQANIFSNVKGLEYYQAGESDPYITLQEDDEEREEMEILESDNLILACKTEDEVSYLEVFVYEEDNLYVHHDIMLPSFPLCVEWLSHPLGNFVAIGTFDPQVEIWDLDTLDPLFPTAILGQIPDASLSVPKQKKGGPARVSKRIQTDRHIDAVMSISWNANQPNLIATGSADTTVKLWDLNRPDRAVGNYTHHTNKVQQILWNPTHHTVLLSGGHDSTACVLDSRSPASVMKYVLSADVEVCRWDPFNPQHFFVATEDGIVRKYDVRAQKELFTLHAHDSAVCALALNPSVPGLIITGSADKSVKIWNVAENPTCIVSRDLNAGKIFTAEFCMDSPWKVAVSGSGGKVVVWNLEENAANGTVRGGAEVVEVEEILEVESEGESGEETEGDYSDEDMEDV